MKKYEYFELNNNLYIQRVNPYVLTAPSPSPEWTKFDMDNSPLKWVGDKLPEGTVLREEEIDYQIRLRNGQTDWVSKDEVKGNNVLAARLKSQLTQREGEQPSLKQIVNAHTEKLFTDYQKAINPYTFHSSEEKELTVEQQSENMSWVMFEDAANREQGEAEQREPEWMKGKYHVRLAGNTCLTCGNTFINNDCCTNCGFSEVIDSPASVSSQPVTEPVKGEEAETPHVIIKSGSVYDNRLFSSLAQARNYVAMRNPKRKWRKGDNETVMVCALHGTKFIFQPLDIHK